MKIILISFYNIIGNAGGAERVLCDMANEFNRRKNKVSIICCDRNVGMPFYNLSYDVELINLNGTGNDFKGPLYIKLEREFKRIFGTLNKEDYKIRYNYSKISKKLKSVIKRINPDIIITYDPYSMTVLKSLIKNTSPTIAMLHSPANTFFKENMSTYMLNGFKKVDCIQVLIKSDVNIIKNIIENMRIKYIPNSVKINQNKNNLGNHKIIIVGRITRIKRQYLLLESFNKIKNEFPEWTIDVVGGTGGDDDIEYKRKLIDYINNNNIDEKISFTGLVKNVTEYLNKADIFALPSEYEGMPLALMEAMAAGLPAIGYKSCPAVNELIIDGYNGFLCEDGTDDFADKLKILMLDVELRKKMGQNARESMMQYAPEKIWNQWEALINEVVNNHKEN